MVLLNNEHTILVSDNQEIVLTNFRIINESKSTFMGSSSTVLLEDICTIENSYKRDLNFIKMAFLALLSGFAFYLLSSLEIESIQFMATLLFQLNMVVVIASLILFFLSKRRLILLETKGGRIFKINLHHMSGEQSDEFVRHVLETKMKGKN